jgi:hypothetical protein
MPVFKVTYIFNSLDLKTAQDRAWNSNEYRGCRMKVTRVMGLRPRKAWGVFRDGVLYDKGGAKAWTKKTATGWLKLSLPAAKSNCSTHKFDIRVI